MFASTYGRLAWTFLRPGCCFSGKKRSYYLRNFITREFFYYYCRLTLCFPLLDMIPFNYVLSLQRHLMIRRLYTSCWGRVPSSQSTSVVPMKSVELLLCTLCLSTWLNPAFFFFFFKTLLFSIEVTLTFILFVLSISIFYWGHCRLNRNSTFSSGIQKSNFLLKVFFSTKYVLCGIHFSSFRYILVHSDTEWLRFKVTSVSSSHWQKSQKVCASTTINTSKHLNCGKLSENQSGLWELGHLFFLHLFLSEPGIVPGAEDSLDQLLTFSACIFISSIWYWSWRGA